MIIFLYGENTFLSRRKLNEIRDKFIREVNPGGDSVVVLGGEKLTAEKLSEAVGAPSLFSRRRMIIVDKIFANKDRGFRERALAHLKDAEKKKSDGQDNIIVARSELPGAGTPNDPLFRFLSRLKYAQNFKPLSNTEITGWIKSETEARGGKIKNRAAAALAGLAGGDLWKISGEIDKLIAFKKGRQEGMIAGGETVTEIDGEDVESLVKGGFDENIFALTDALSAKKKALAAKLLEQELEAGAAESYLMHMITRQFKTLLRVRQALDLGHGTRKIITGLKLHPYVAQKCLSQARGFTLPLLKKIFNHLIKADKDVKSGRTDIKTALTVFIARV